MEQKEIPTSAEKWFICSNVIEKRNSPCWADGIAAIILLSHSFINLCRHWFNGLESQPFTTCHSGVIYFKVHSNEYAAHDILLCAQYCFDGSDDVEVICCWRGD